MERGAVEEVAEAAADDLDGRSRQASVTASRSLAVRRDCEAAEEVGCDEERW